MQERGEDPRAGAAEGVTEGDGTAEGIEVGGRGEREDL